MWQGDWVNDRMKGDGTYKFANGDVYVGEFSWDHPEGIGKATYADGSVYEGAFKEGLPSGRGTITSTNSDGEVMKWTGLWSHGKRVPGSDIIIDEKEDA
jgi:hypothetical protein